MRTTKKIITSFGNDPGFDLRTGTELTRETVEAEFNRLKAQLVADLLASNETLRLRGSLQQAANEAAGLAWTTAFPLLVFPALLAEKAQGLRTRDQHQQRIHARCQETAGAVL